MNPKILPDVFYLLFMSVGRAALGATLKPGMGDAWIVTLQDYVDRNGKFTKFPVAYSPVAPPPVFWNYICGQCFAYVRAEKGCKWVEERGMPNPGKIEPCAWCSIWMPQTGVKPFSWIGKMPWFIAEGLPRFP